MKTTLTDLLATNTPIVTDGAMGTMLFTMGLDSGDSTAILNLRSPEKVRSVHRQYITAGAQIIISNTFVANEPGLARYGYADQFEAINHAAMANARAEADAAPHPVLVGGNLGPTGEMFAPFGSLTPSRAVALYAAQAAILAQGGADVFWIETMTDVSEAVTAIEGCRQAAPGLPVIVTMSFGKGGRTMMGDTPEKAIEAFRPLGVAAIGANCGEGPEVIKTAIERMHRHDPSMILVSRSNAGLPRLVGGETIYDGTPEVMAEYAIAIRDLGARIIGACCGSTPFHIRAIHDSLRG